MSTAPNTDAQQRYDRLMALFDAALDLPVAERDAFIVGTAAQDPALAAEVRSLLESSTQLDGFLELSTGHDRENTRVRTALADRYLIRERIATGGMAAVYRADDIRHGRSVAIKVLTWDSLAIRNSKASEQRFLDEIRVTARLQHANVMPLFDSGVTDGLCYYVMPFIDGETLRQRLRRTGPMSLDDAIEICRGVASALGHAHANGVIHRDLKPENILLRDDQALVCDFGIARAMSGSDGARLTQSGIVIGTPQYMSPEQASAATDIDARADIYALGAILYEMLVGDPPHVASTSEALLAKVRAEKPSPVVLLRASIPLAVSHVVDRALSKLPVDRYSSAQAMMRALESARRAEDADVEAVSGERVKRSRNARLLLAIGAIGVIAAALVLMARQTRAPLPAEPATRFVVTPIADAAIGRAPTLTPDGSAIVYAGSAASGRTLFVRRVNQLEAHALRGTRGVLNAWVSPDGRRIAYTSVDDRIRVIDVDGGNMRDVAGVFRYAEGAWLDDSILVVDSYGQQGLSWIKVAGGQSHPLTALDSRRHDTVHGAPLSLGDGRSIVFVTSRNRSGPGSPGGELSLVRFDSTATQPIAYRSLGVDAVLPFGFIDGWLLYLDSDERRLMAVRFDITTGSVSGAPISVLEQEGGQIARVMLAENGTLLYARRVQPKNTPVLVDMNGVAKPVTRLSGGFMNPRVSPDGRRIVVQSATQAGNDAWLFDLATGTQTRLTQSGTVLGPAWTADGQRIVYATTRGAQDALWSSAVSGDGDSRMIVNASGAFAASPATVGGVLLFQRRTNGVWSIWQAPVTPQQSAIPIVEETFDAFMPSLSPDGHWLSYASSESGRYEIYIRPFPGPGPAVQVSTDGGTEPVWSPDGRRLYFRGDRQLKVATLSTGSIRSVTSRRVLFSDVFDGDMPMPHRNFDVTPDGTHFVMIAPSQDDAPETIVVLNWLSEFRARVASAGVR